MGYKFCRPTAGAAAYTALDTIKGQVNTLLINSTGVIIRVVGPTADATAAAALDTAGTYMRMESSAAAVYLISCDPCQTWIKAETGGGNLQAQFNW